jgi:hypothetical protein
VSDLGVWQPLKPDEVAAIFAPLDAPWWIAGGRAIDAFLGYESREHGDIDVAVLRRDQIAAQELLAGWDLQAADPPGSLRRWQPGEVLPEAVHDIWCRPAADAAWGIQLMLDSADCNEWEYRRNPAVTRSLDSLRWLKDGVPYLVVEVQLLYKANYLSPKNEADFDLCLPKLDADQRRWLRDALRLAYPGHPWTSRLDAGAES